jgi:hypothetical protein
VSKSGVFVTIDTHVRLAGRAQLQAAGGVEAMG